MHTQEIKSDNVNFELIPVNEFFIKYDEVEEGGCLFLKISEDSYIRLNDKVVLMCYDDEPVYSVVQVESIFYKRS